MSNYTLVRTVLEVVGKEMEEYKAEIERLRRRVKELERTNNDDICRKVFAEHKALESVPPPIVIPEVVQVKPVKPEKPVENDAVKQKKADYQRKYQLAYREKKKKEKLEAKTQ